MAVPQGRLQYAGIDAEGSFQVSRTASTVADPIQGKFLLGADLPRVGNIVVSYGNSAITLRNCRAVRQTITQGSNGRWKDVQFEDRRWVWRFKTVDGQYNYFLRGIQQKQKNARQLATICLEAMGEFGVDVSSVPADVFPIVEFGGQIAAEQLESLIRPFGCIVTLGLDDRAYVRKIGSGRNAPNDQRVMDYTSAYEPPIIPETLRIEGAPIRFQRDLPLQAVGYEADTFEVKQFVDLSYCPNVSGTKTFSRCNIAFTQITDPKLRELAVSCIWKLYRVQGTQGKTLKVPVPTGSKLPNKVWEVKLIDGDDIGRILPLNSSQLTLWTGALIPAEVIGYFHDLRPGQHNNVDPIPEDGATPKFNPDLWEKYQGNSMRTSKSEHIYQGSFDIDEEKGYVKFGIANYRIKRNANVIDTDKHYPSKLLLRTSFHLRHPDTNEPIRPFYDYKPSSRYITKGLVHTIRVEELEYECGVDNQTKVADFERSARLYALREMAKYDLGDSVSVPCKGFVFDFFPDGSISSVRIERSENGEATTTIDWQSENPIERLTYDEKAKRLQELANQRFIESQRAINARRQARKGARKAR